MALRPNVTVWLAPGAAIANPALHRTGSWQLPPQALEDLQLARRQRTNVLLVGVPPATRVVAEMLGIEEEVVTWRPGEPLDLPAPAIAGTVVLHEVERLTAAAQSTVLRWLDQTCGRTRVVSTTLEPLWPRVQTGMFSETLYYRLNVVCLSTLGLSAPHLGGARVGGAFTARHPERPRHTGSARYDAGTSCRPSSSTSMT
jgi:hypothetical protein